MRAKTDDILLHLQWKMEEEEFNTKNFLKSCSDIMKETIMCSR